MLKDWEIKSAFGLIDKAINGFDQFIAYLKNEVSLDDYPSGLEEMKKAEQNIRLLKVLKDDERFWKELNKLSVNKLNKKKK